MTEPAPAEGDDRDEPQPVAPIPLPPDPLGPWLGPPPGCGAEPATPTIPPGGAPG